jgi:type VI protein secretion system component Hcp
MSKKVGFSAAVLFLGVIGMITFTASPAVAHKEFKDTFKAKYVKPDSTAVNDVALAKAFDEASCTVCHAGGDDKKIRNDYGKQLALRLKDEDTKDVPKIQAALDEVARLKSNPSDPASPTFGEKIANGKLPAAN